MPARLDCAPAAPAEMFASTCGVAPDPSGKATEFNPFWSRAVGGLAACLALRAKSARAVATAADGNASGGSATAGLSTGPASVRLPSSNGAGPDPAIMRLAVAGRTKLRTPTKRGGTACPSGASGAPDELVVSAAVVPAAPCARWPAFGAGSEPLSAGAFNGAAKRDDKAASIEAVTSSDRGAGCACRRSSSAVRAEEGVCSPLAFELERPSRTPAKAKPSAAVACAAYGGFAGGGAEPGAWAGGGETAVISRLAPNRRGSPFAGAPPQRL